jgi:hypothetical protein
VSHSWNVKVGMGKKPLGARHTVIVTFRKPVSAPIGNMDSERQPHQNLPAQPEAETPEHQAGGSHEFCWQRLCTQISGPRAGIR